MEADQILKNGAGDVLSPTKHNEKAALFQVISGANAKFTDIYFVTKLESVSDSYGQKMHLAGGGNWEDKGTYVRGKQAAIEAFDKLNPDEAKEANNSYYDDIFKKQLQ